MHKGVRMALRVVLLLATLLEGVGMAGSGSAKFYAPIWRTVFGIWGYPMWFMYGIGALETIGGASLFVPKAASWAAMVLMVIMAGAVVTTGVHPIPEHRFTWGAPAAHLAVLSVIALLRWKERWRAGSTRP